MNNKLEVGGSLPGLVLGAAIGDAIGLPFEGLGRRRIAKLNPGPFCHRLFLRRGLGSDDTEHLYHTGMALLQSGKDVAVFQKILSRRLRWWLLLLPAGVGMATARALAKLWLGWKPGNNGVFSAGNGPAMRSAIIGACHSEDTATLVKYVTASTTLTHTDPKALAGALAVAHAAAWIRLNGSSPASLIATWQTLAPDPEWQHAMSRLEQSLAARATVADFASTLGCSRRVSGYIYHTVPVALYAWLFHRADFQTTLSEVIRCGGDTDTVAAIAGALAGMDGGESAIPKAWLDGWIDWPLTLRRLRSLGEALENRTPDDSSLIFPMSLAVPRNLAFLTIVLAHGFRRLLPPW